MPRFEVLGDWQLEVECEVVDQAELFELMNGARTKFADYIPDFEVAEVITEHKINYLPMGKEAYAELVLKRQQVPSDDKLIWTTARED